MKYYRGKTISTDDIVYGYLEYYKKENQYYITEYDGNDFTWGVHENTIERVWFEVNTLNCAGVIETSNTFEDYNDAFEFYDSIDKTQNKEILVVDDDGMMFYCLITNYGH